MMDLLLTRLGEYVHVHARRPLTGHDLAAEAGMRLDELRVELDARTGTTPAAFIRCRRLHGAHDELRVGDSSVVTVSAVAKRWGFAHLARFAEVYVIEFGQTPDETLRGPAGPRS